MTKGIRRGALVTGKRWYMPHRVYGRVVAYFGGGRWIVEGRFGLEVFMYNTLRPVRVQR